MLALQHVSIMGPAYRHEHAQQLRGMGQNSAKIGKMCWVIRQGAFDVMLLTTTKPVTRKRNPRSLITVFNNHKPVSFLHKTVNKTRNGFHAPAMGKEEIWRFKSQTGHFWRVVGSSELGLIFN